MTAYPSPFALPEFLRAEGFSLLALEETGSTNADALKALEAGQDRLFIVAHRQSGGRGRHGRPWSSPPGNLYMSLALAAPCPTASSPLLGFVAGVSLAEAVLALAPGLKPVVHLKWPNDLLLSGAKLAGLLLEGTSLSGGRTGIAIGIGVNVAARPEGVDQQAAVLAEHARAADSCGLFAKLAECLSVNLALFDSARGFDAIRSRWLELAMPRGTSLRVKLPSGEERGIFAGLDGNGHLLLEVAGAIKSVMVGDVFPIEAPLDPETALRSAR